MDVSIRCLCPPLADGAPRHPDGDRVTLRDRLDFRQAVTIRNEARVLARQDGGATEGEMLAVLAESYLLHGIVAWSLVDAKGKPLPPSRDNIRAVLMADYDEAERVAEVADDAYSEAVVLPLFLGASRSSPGGRTGDSTSRTNGGSRNPTRSSRSSISTTPTDDTATTSRARGGDSKPSPRLESVA